VKRRICLVTATPLTLHAFMRNHIRRLAERYEVTAVSNFESNPGFRDQFSGTRLVNVPIVRPIRPAADLLALAMLIRFFLRERFDAVHSVTPKAGLLAMTAARCAGIPNRIHNLSGQVWATRQGLARALLKSVDRITLANANYLLSDSSSQTRFLENEHVVSAARVEMLGCGSICGVDPLRFQPNPDVRTTVRERLGVPLTGSLILFVGRLNRDKGILDLAQAFSRLASRRRDVWLVVVGGDEAGIGADFERLCGDSLPCVRRVGHSDLPEQFMAAADVLALPSYRESFGLTVIEAAACGVPAVASRVYGLTDAVEENVTGMMHPPGDVAGIESALERLISDPGLRIAMGTAARERALRDFSMDRISGELLAFYGKILC
jgi:glycosyltransferase involved in cell wall biosynthesis